MSANTFGTLFRVTTFGESHGAALGCVVDGCPSGLELDVAEIQAELDRRRPGQSSIVTQRQEMDKIEVLSGIFEGKTLGTPIALVVQNTDQRPKDYAHLQESYRPSHADFVWDKKYGHRDPRGGGRSSARETLARVAAGAIARKLIHQKAGITVTAYVDQVGPLRLEKPYMELDFSAIESNDLRCPDPEFAERMIQLIREVKKEGDTVGGAITCVIQGCPVGLGEPVFDKLQADLAKACMSINAAKGFEFGSGFEGVAMRGSQHNDPFTSDSEGRIITTTNHSGGIQGGISNGMDIYFRVAFKPVSTLMRPQMSIDTHGNPVEIQGKGRHDPCVVPRAVPIVEAMACLVIADHLLRAKAIL